MAQQEHFHCQIVVLLVLTGGVCLAWRLLSTRFSESWASGRSKSDHELGWKPPDQDRRSALFSLMFFEASWELEEQQVHQKTEGLWRCRHCCDASVGERWGGRPLRRPWSGMTITQRCMQGPIWYNKIKRKLKPSAKRCRSDAIEKTNLETCRGPHVSTNRSPGELLPKLLSALFTHYLSQVSALKPPRRSRVPRRREPIIPGRSGVFPNGDLIHGHNIVARHAPGCSPMGVFSWVLTRAVGGIPCFCRHLQCERLQFLALETPGAPGDLRKRTCPTSTP